MNISQRCSFIYRLNRNYFFQFALKKYKHHLTKHSLFNTHVLHPTKKRHRDECVWVTGRGAVFSVLYLWDEKYRKYFFWKHNAWPYMEIDHVGRQQSDGRRKIMKIIFGFYSHRAIINTPPPYCWDEISYDHANIVFTSFTVCLFMYIHNSDIFVVVYIF